MDKHNSTMRRALCEAGGGMRQFEGVCRAPPPPAASTTAVCGALRDAHRPAPARPPVGPLPFSGIKADLLGHRLVQRSKSPEQMACQVHQAMTHILGLRAAQAWPIRRDAVAKSPPIDTTRHRCPVCEVVSFFHPSPSCNGFACDHCGNCTAGFISYEVPTRNFENVPDGRQWQLIVARDSAERERHYVVRGLAALLDHATEGHIEHACAMVEHFAAHFTIQSMSVMGSAALLLAQSPDVESTHRLSSAPVAPVPRFPCGRCGHRWHVWQAARVHARCRSPDSAQLGPEPAPVRKRKLGSD